MNNNDNNNNDDSTTNQIVGGGADYSEFKAHRNLPIFESIAFTIDHIIQEGLTSDQLRKVISCNNFKRANRLFFEFNKLFAYPLEKIQDGKQMKYRLISKNNINICSDGSSSGGGGNNGNGYDGNNGSVMKDSKKSSITQYDAVGTRMTSIGDNNNDDVDAIDNSDDIRMVDINTTEHDIAYANNDSYNTHMHEQQQQPLMKKDTGGGKRNTKRGFSLKENNPGLMSLQKQWNCKIIMDYLNKVSDR